MYSSDSAVPRTVARHAFPSFPVLWLEAFQLPNTQPVHGWTLGRSLVHFSKNTKPQVSTATCIHMSSLAARLPGWIFGWPQISQWREMLLSTSQFEEMLFHQDHAYLSDCITTKMVFVIIAVAAEDVTTLFIFPLVRHYFHCSVNTPVDKPKQPGWENSPTLMGKKQGKMGEFLFMAVTGGYIVPPPLSDKKGSSTPWRFSTATSLGLLLQDWVEKNRGCRSLSIGLLRFVLKSY